MAQKMDATDDQLATGRERSIALVTLLLPHFWLRRYDASGTLVVKIQLTTVMQDQARSRGQSPAATED